MNRAAAILLLASCCGCAGLWGPEQWESPYSDEEVATYDARWMAAWEERAGTTPSAVVGDLDVRGALRRLDTFWIPGAYLTDVTYAGHAAGFTDWPGSVWARARIRLAWTPGEQLTETARGHELVHLARMAQGLDPQRDHVGWDAPGGFNDFIREVNAP